ncbi:MAG: YceI family protein [Myxococcales bacterium]|nr:YceI family protein [Myxococcales bacterium]
MKPVAGRIEVLTFKQGLLSKVAHDLLLELRRFDLRTDGKRVEGTFLLTSLSVEGVMRSGVLDAHGLSESDRHDINGNVQKKVLHTDDFPEAQFVGEVARGAGRHSVTGRLVLAGKTQDLSVGVREADGRWRGEVELVPSRWGIQPFKALLGAIKLEDRVVVRFDCPVVEL